MPESPHPTVLLEKRGSVAIVTLNRPEVMNAINLQMRNDLHALMSELRRDSAVAVVVLTGSGDKAFSSGMDLKEFAEQLKSVPLSELRRYRWEKSEGLADFDKPIIAAVNGLAIGGGIELCLQCDICFASDTASFTFAEVSRGLLPGNGGTQRLARRIGRAHALEMILSARKILAHEALEMGLIDHLVHASELMDRALLLADQIAANAPVAVRSAKQAVVRGLDLSLQEGLNLERDLATFLYTTEDSREGPRAFIEKRTPQWQNR